MRLISHDDLEQWVGNLLLAAGLTESHSVLVSRQLVQTSLWGIDSHGVARLPHYLCRIEKGSINPRPELTFQSTASAVGNVDGDHGLGIVVCSYSMDHAIALAKKCGIGIVGISNSTHCGAIGLFARQATRAGCIGISFTHSDSFVVPYGGKKAFFGTNPISIAMPSLDEEKPLCVDMATSIVPWNKIMNARRDGVRVPNEWGVDELGNQTSNPDDIAAVLPTAGYKGYALAFLIDMLCGPLNRMPFGPHIPKMYDDLERNRCLGSLVIAINPVCFSGGVTLKNVINQAIEEVKIGSDAVMYPGEPEYKTAEKRRSEGIPLEPTLWSDLKDWSSKLQVESFN